jgi:endoglycosylceramidase
MNDSLNDEDILNLTKWGMNFVRLGVMWEGVERQAGVYDTEYLAKVDALITRLGEAGIYTLVDAHQDVFARTICGEGVPDFYAKEVIGDRASCLTP